MKTRAPKNSRGRGALRGACAGVLCTVLAGAWLGKAEAQPGETPASTTASAAASVKAGPPGLMGDPQLMVPKRVIPNLYTLKLAAALQRVVESDYTPPAPRNGRVRVVLDPSGAVASMEIVTSAGFPALDRAMEAAAARFAPGEKLRLPFPTDPEMARQATRIGFMVPIKFAGPQLPAQPAPTVPAGAASEAPTSRRPERPSVPGGHTPASGATAPKER